MDLKTDRDETSRTAAAVKHLLSFDVEEYFQVEAASKGVPSDQWDHYPKRLGPVVDCILELLVERGITATFFVLGWPGTSGTSSGASPRPVMRSPRTAPTTT